MRLGGISPTLRGGLFALAGFGTFAIHDMVIKTLGGEYAAPQILFFSILFGFPIIVTQLVCDKTPGTLLPKNPGWTALRTICVVLNGLFAFYAFSVLPLSEAYAILFTMPLIITLLSVPLLGERIGMPRAAAVLTGLAGVVIVLQPSASPLDLAHLGAMGAAICGALVGIAARKIGGQERTVVLLLYPMVASFLMLGAILPFVYKPMPLEHLALTACLAVLSVTGGLLIIMAYRHAETGIVAPMQYSQIIWALIFGWLIFGESVTLIMLMGILLIAGSGVFVLIREAEIRRSGHGGVKIEATEHEDKPALGQA